ncbi:MAG: hypothetical protein KBS95_01980, partial [Alistipes sp.]|nr:hypothetical protein [Candidatus Alistipes equi]
MDKGFYSAKNINILDEMNLQYIIPLKRDCNLIDYSKASVDYLDEGGEAFRYHGREIYMYRKDI